MTDIKTDNPLHPGLFLNETVIKPLGIGVTETAQRLGMSRIALSRVLNGKARISSDLVVRLEKADQSKAYTNKILLTKIKAE